MDKNTAASIAKLLNERNQLTQQYTAEDILKNAENYIYEQEGEILVACVEVKKVQWYQSEILHLSVNENYEGQGYGRQLIAKAEEKSIEDGAKILQCTIRTDNKGSEHVFSISDYKQVACFHNPASGNDVGVWQKVVSVRP